MRFLRRLRRIVHGTLGGMCLSCFVALLPAAFAQGIQLNHTQIGYYSDKYGRAAADRIRGWYEVMSENKTAEEKEKLELVNRFFNRLNFVDDIDHWGKRDYWATPIEFLTSNGGDCEDFAIAKYLTLREMGVPAERMRITYVKALKLDQAHMVLTYYQTSDAEPLVLDNLEPDITPASGRPDLIPVYSFNGDSLWVAKELTGRGTHVGGSERVSLWRDLVARMQKENNATTP